MSLTIKDIAKMAGVSTATVSLVLSDNPRISEQTKRRVRHIVEKEGFIPNSIASGFAKKSLATMGLVLSLAQKEALRHPYVFEMMAGVEQGAREALFHLMILNKDLLTPDPKALASLWHQKRVDGFVIQFLPHLRPALNTLLDWGIPLVVIGDPGEGYWGAWVDGDNRGAGALAWDTLKKAGYRVPGYVGFKGDGIALDRWEGLVQRASQEGAVGHAHWTDGLEDVAKGVLDNLGECDALVCANHYLALELIRQDFGLITFDDLPFMDYLRPGLSTIDIDVFTLGTVAARELVKILNGERDQYQERLPLYRLVERGSTAGPRA